MTFPVQSLSTLAWASFIAFPAGYRPDERRAKDELGRILGDHVLEERVHDLDVRGFATNSGEPLQLVLKELDVVAVAVA
jgi:hypothetical protein